VEIAYVCANRERLLERPGLLSITSCSSPVLAPGYLCPAECRTGLPRLCPKWLLRFEENRGLVGSASRLRDAWPVSSSILDASEAVNALNQQNAFAFTVCRLPAANPNVFSSFW
jgi:hypothetical protein